MQKEKKKEKKSRNWRKTASRAADNHWCCWSWFASQVTAETSTEYFLSFVLFHRYFLTCFLKKDVLRDCFSFFPQKWVMMEKVVSSHFWKRRNWVLVWVVLGAEGMKYEVKKILFNFSSYDMCPFSNTKTIPIK